MSAIIDKARDLDHLLATAVQDDKDAGIFRCRRDIFTNEDLFELEMKHIFESNWVYLAHESQIQKTTIIIPPILAASPLSSPATRPVSCTP